MDCITVSLPANSYPIYLERGLLTRCGDLLPRHVKRWFIVSDEQVWALYGADVMQSLGALSGGMLTFPAGEASKSLAVYETLCRNLLQQGITRSDGILALGGGVTGDLAGFAAATVLRGVALVHLPTTLLSQVDSSIGGKTGLNLPEGKNLLGAFYQPHMVLIDPDCLDTLDARQMHSGMAEVIKYGMIADESILTQLEDTPDYSALIARCCRIKAQLVGADERDSGARRLLNFGHTFAHIYEAAGNFSRWTHGEAVAAGMMQMLRWEARHGYATVELQTRLSGLLDRYSLPSSIPCPLAQAQEYLLRDKKRQGDTIAAVIVSRPGSAEIKTLLPAQLWEGWET